MIIVTNAWNQRGWTGRDHTLDDSRLVDLIGKQFASLDELRTAAESRAQSYAKVEYEMGERRYRADFGPTGIPGRNVQTVTDITYEVRR